MRDLKSEGNSTAICHRLGKAATVKLDRPDRVVLDVLGREVRTLVDAVQGAGFYTDHFDASNLASGIYLLRLKMTAQSWTRTMLASR